MLRKKGVPSAGRFLSLFLFLSHTNRSSWYKEWLAHIPGNRHRCYYCWYSRNQSVVGKEDFLLYYFEEAKKSQQRALLLLYQKSWLIWESALCHRRNTIIPCLLPSRILRCLRKTVIIMQFKCMKRVTKKDQQPVLVTSDPLIFHSVLFNLSSLSTLFYHSSQA